MFHSQSLSRKGPLASVWVAAYCHKRLKKAQVTDTDISLSVDKIIQEELEFVTYRVLGYFLLGVVRIYSKKVEYLFKDCTKVLIQVKGFVFADKRDAAAKIVAAPVSSITLPKRFELDAFELDLLEDFGGGNQVPPEEITIRDNTWRNEGIGHYSLHENHWEDIISDTCPADYSAAEEVRPLLLMDIDVGVSTSGGQSNPETRIKRLRDSCFSEEDHLARNNDRVEELDAGVSTPLDQRSLEVRIKRLRDSNFLEEDNLARSCSGAEAEETFQDPIRPLDKDYQSDQEGVQDGSFPEEDHNGTNPGKALQDSDRPLQEHLQSDGELMLVLEVPLLEKEQLLVCEENILEPNVEVFRKNMDLEKYDVNFEMIANAEREPPEQIGMEHKEDFICKEMGKELETPVSENLKQKDAVTDHPAASLSLGATPTKLTTPQGAPTPDFMLIPTPTPKERRRTKRKRTCLFDDMIVLPNSIIKKSIHDPSDLVCKRKKVHHSAFAIWRASRASNLFLEPLIHYSAPELRSLFYETKLKVQRQLKDVQVPEKVHIPELEKELLEQAGIAPETPVPEKVHIPESEKELSEQTGIAPETPVRWSSSRRTFESPTTAKSDEMGPEKPVAVEVLDGEPSMQEDQQLSFTLMNEEISPLEDTEKLYGWTGRTSTIARHLQKVFDEGGNQITDVAVNLMQISKGRTRRESANLFYEILVLGNGGFIAVEQESAYGDILLRKKPEWGLALGAADGS